MRWRSSPRPRPWRSPASSRMAAVSPAWVRSIRRPCVPSGRSSTCGGSRPLVARTSGPGSTTVPGPRAGRRPRRLSVPGGRGRRAARDPGGAGACRRHRARPFPLHRQRRDRGPARAATGLRPQRDRAAVRGRRLARGARLAGRVSGDSTVAFALAFARAAEAATGCEPPPRAHGSGRCWPSWSASPTTSAISASSATTPPTR